MVLTGLLASMPMLILAGAFFVAQFSAVKHRRHVPLLAGDIDRTDSCDPLHPYSDLVPQKSRVVGIL